MIRASRRNKARVCEILIDSFQKDPHTNWFTSPNDQGRDKRIRSLMNFAAEEGFARQSVYLSDDKNAVAIWKSPTEKKMSIPLVHAYLDFGVKMGWSKILYAQKCRIGSYLGLTTYLKPVYL